MVLWRSDATWAVLLRASRQPGRHIPRIVVHTVRNSSPSLPPRDDGDHDPDIDLITLRRKQSSESGNAVLSREAKDAIKAHRKVQRADDVLFEHPSPAAGHSENHPVGPANESVTHRPTENVDEHANRLSSTSTAPLVSSVLTQGDEGSRFSTSTRDTLDPYLVHYLKSLRSQSSKTPKPVITVPDHPAPQDLDVDSLRPVDLRSNYGRHEFKSSVGGHNLRISNGGPSGEPGVIPERLVHDCVKALNLPSSGGKVIIPRALLVRLIEETINLSGAAVRGNDVVIERYSPTWHRFARLLRTSDLHKISTLPTSDRSDPAYTPETGGLESVKSSKTPERASQTTTALDESIEPINAYDKIDSSLSAVTEREYVVLAIDSKKSRIISTRFSRLLDGSSEPVPISTEDLLKVEYLDR
jgi:hypothetical protein